MLDTRRQEVCRCMCVVLQHPLCALQPPAHTPTEILSSNCILLQVNNLIIEVAFCSVFEWSQPRPLLSASPSNLRFQWLSISRPYFCLAINNSGNRTTQRPSVEAWILSSNWNWQSVVWKTCLYNGFASKYQDNTGH